MRTGDGMELSGGLGKRYIQSAFAVLPAFQEKLQS